MAEFQAGRGNKMKHGPASHNRGKLPALRPGMLCGCPKSTHTCRGQNGSRQVHGQCLRFLQCTTKKETNYCKNNIFPQGLIECIDALLVSRPRARMVHQPDSPFLPHLFPPLPPPLPARPSPSRDPQRVPSVFLDLYGAS